MCRATRRLGGLAECVRALRGRCGGGAVAGHAAPDVRQAGLGAAPPPARRPDRLAPVQRGRRALPQRVRPRRRRLRRRAALLSRASYPPCTRWTRAVCRLIAACE